MLFNKYTTYLFRYRFVWLVFLLRIGGNPTFIIPFTTLLIVFYFLYAPISAGVLHAFKIFSFETYLWILLESAIIYIIIWSLAC